MKIHFFGASGEVTGSNFLVETTEHKYVVDCGLFQGSHELSQHNSEPFAFEPSEVEAVIVTHAHLDHIGRLPKLVKDGFTGPIYATEATIELSTLTLKDALGIMEHHERDERVAALYNQTDLNRTLAQFKPVRYHQKFTLAGNDSATLYDAGHILGSASVLVEADGKKAVFSGDLGHWPNVLLPHSETPIDADIVVTEATYGGVERQDHSDRLQVIQDALEWTVQRNGVLLVPAFSIERSQELLYLLNELARDNKLPHFPIYFDSPLGIEALEVFERHQELFTKEVQDRLKTDHDVFSFQGLVITTTGEESRTINEQKPPKMIIAGSGMMAGGRIMHHLKRYVEYENTLLLVIGYQAEGTLGREIVDGAKMINVAGAHVPVRATIKVVDIFSGHADNSELLKWLEAVHFPNNTPRIAVVHSDPDRAKVFADELTNQLHANVTVAKHGDALEV